MSAGPLIGLVIGALIGLVVVGGLQYVYVGTQDFMNMSTPTGWGLDWGMIYIAGAAILCVAGMAIGARADG